MVSLTLVTCASTSAASPVANHKHHHKNKNHHKKLTPISFGLAAYVCEFGPYLVAKDKGFFTKEGLTVTFKQVAGSQSISALESGSLQLAGAAGSAVAAVMKGAPVKAISVDLESPPYLVVAKKTISSLSALAGGKLGIMTEGDTVQFGINELMAQNGINVTSVAEVPVGYAPNNISALQGGSVPASYLEASELPALKPSTYNLLGTTLGHVHLPIAGTAVSTSYLHSHKDVVKKFLLATALAEKYYLHHASYAISALQKYSGQTAAEASAGYHYCGEWPLSGTVPMSSRINIIKQTAAAATIHLTESPKKVARKIYDFKLTKKIYKKVFHNHKGHSITKKQLPSGWKLMTS